ncbi:MAG: DNA-processing protein DprA, partial [Nitrospirae bacterium]
MENLRYWLGLNMVNGVGPITIKHLISVFGSPKLVFSANEDELLNIANITKSKAEAIVNFKEWEHVDREIERSERGEFSIITMEHENYPLGLRQIDDPPPVLYVKGELRDSDRFSISIVGSRRCTGYGVSVAEMMSNKLSSYGLTIVSGMAKGIDSIAHRAALSAGGRSIGVLGCGIDIIYPKLNVDLFRNIPASGAILTEFPTGTRPYKENFPRRN